MTKFLNAPQADHQEVHKSVKKLGKQLKRNRSMASFDAATHTVQTMMTVLRNLDDLHFRNVEDLLDAVKLNGKYLAECRPLLVTVGNVIRRICTICRNAFQEQDTDEGVNRGHMLDIFHRRSIDRLHSSKEPSSPNLSDKQVRDIRNSIESHINEFLEEISNAYDAIGIQAVDHLHSDEIVMTYGSSKTVRNFLLTAAKFRSLSVFIPEAAPDFKGQDMARSLSECHRKLQILVFSDACIFAMMPRVNKVILGCYNVLANGGILGPSGIAACCRAAKHFSVPVIVVVAAYKLSPLLAFDQDSFNELQDPQQILGYHNAHFIDKVDVVNPAYDYVEPELVDLIITNFGGHAPAFIPRINKQFYHPDDLDLDTRPKFEPWYTPQTRPMESFFG